MKTSLLSAAKHWKSVGRVAAYRGLRFDEVAVVENFKVENGWIKEGFEEYDRRAVSEGKSRSGMNSTRSTLPVYVEQYGAFWKFSAVEWEIFLRAAIKGYRIGEGYVLPQANLLKRRPSCIATEKDGGFYRNSNSVRFLKILDWTLDDYHSEAEELFGPEGAVAFLKKTL